MRWSITAVVVVASRFCFARCASELQTNARDSVCLVHFANWADFACARIAPNCARTWSCESFFIFFVKAALGYDCVALALERPPLSSMHEEERPPLPSIHEEERVLEGQTDSFLA